MDKKKTNKKNNKNYKNKPNYKELYEKERAARNLTEKELAFVSGRLDLCHKWIKSFWGLQLRLVWYVFSRSSYKSAMNKK